MPSRFARTPDSFTSSQCRSGPTSLLGWKRTIAARWSGARFECVPIGKCGDIYSYDAQVRLGSVDPADVQVKSTPMARRPASLSGRPWLSTVRFLDHRESTSTAVPRLPTGRRTTTHLA
jgi:hypothetical protein